MFDDEAPMAGTTDLLIFAALKAGFGGPKSKHNPRNMEFTARRAVSKSHVKHAINEESKRRNRLLLPIALKSARRILTDPKHRDHAKVVTHFLNLIEALANRLDVTVEHTMPVSPERIDGIHARIEQLARRAGVFLPPPAPVIDAECAEVQNAEQDVEQSDVSESAPT
jgi:hypothetical protein